MAVKRGFKIEEPIEEDLRDENEIMKMFSAKVATCHSYIKNILVCVEKLQEIRDKIQTIIGTEKERTESQLIEEHIQTALTNQNYMKKVLESLQEEVAKSKEEDKESLSFNN